MRARFLWSLLFLGGDVWTVVRWITPEGLSMTLSLWAPEYSALLFLFSSCFFALNWSWIQSRRPSRRFADLYLEIARCRDIAQRIVNSRNTLMAQRGSQMFSSIAELQLQLHDLGVTSPEEPPDSDRNAVCWYNFLVHLASHARTGDLARFKSNNDQLLEIVRQTR